MRIHRLPQNKLRDLVEKAVQDLAKGTGFASLNMSTLTHLPAPKEKAKLIFTEEAHMKMSSLVKNCTKEIAWHGVVQQISSSEYRVTDILVYPQNVTAATVDSDKELYPLWLDQLEDDVYNNIRLQGHSHVNMPVSPSVTDTDYYAELIEHIKNFYIFIIVNKSEKIFVNIFDIENNVVWESTDIEVQYETSGINYQTWYHDVAEPMLISRVPVATGKKQEAAAANSLSLRDPSAIGSFDNDDDFWEQYRRRGSY